MKTEVLAPAGSIEALKAALYAGADAIYTGGRLFGARAYADNLSDDQLIECIDYCHLHDRQLYLTVNTLFKDQELVRLSDYLAPFYEAGLDAVIIQDLGAMQLVKEQFPGLAIHASTQMTSHSVESAKLLERLGADRVVTSREMSLKEIHEIRKQTTLEIETFVHGALCYSYSGQCLMSSMIGGRSGNRGRCAQPCRLPWSYDGSQDAYLLSPKDICTLKILPELLEAGIDSLKIEGRMKSPEYAAGVAAMYRKYTDLYHTKGRAGYQVEEQDIQNLMDLYNRGGFSEGYFKQRNGKSMMSVLRQNHFGTPAAAVTKQQGRSLQFKALETLHKGDMLEGLTIGENIKEGQSFSVLKKDKLPVSKGAVWNRTYNAALMQQLKEQYLNKEFACPIQGTVTLSPEQPLMLSISCGDATVQVEGEQVSKALNAPLTEDKIKRQLQKTGGTSFTFSDLDVRMTQDCFIRMQSLNECRREALEQLKEQLLSKKRRIRQNGNTAQQQKFSACDETGTPYFSVSFEEKDGVFAVLGKKEIQRIYLDSRLLEENTAEETLKIIAACHQAQKTCWFILPAVFRDETRSRYEKEDMQKQLAAFDGFLLKNIESMEFIVKQFPDRAFAADFNFYSFNQWAKERLLGFGCSYTTAPLELNARELATRGMSGDEMILYGYFPVMTSAQCLTKTTGKCLHTPGIHVLKDRKGMHFRVENRCYDCYNLIYNSVPLSLHGMSREIMDMHPKSLRLMFTTESKCQIETITDYYLGEYGRAEKKIWAAEDFTRGHFKRGIE